MPAKHHVECTFTDDELRALAGPVPQDPGFRETIELRWMTWQFIRKSQNLPDAWVKMQLKTTILGYHPSSIKVIGVTRNALREFSSPDGTFPSDAARRRGTFQRAHLYPRRQCVVQLLNELPITLTQDELAEWVWNRDITVLSLVGENDRLEDRSYFEEHAITFSNPGGSLFRDLGSVYAYGAKERALFRELWENSENRN
jgi:hypothetical protein